MADTLNIYGVTYSGVTGIKAYDSNNNVQTFVRPKGTKTITQNGTGIDVAAYADVDVNVSGGGSTLGTKTITANGEYDATDDNLDGYSEVTVSVPASAVDTGTKNISISANGTTTENVVGYASASITANVPNSYSAGDEGKVVDNGALVSQTAHADVTPTTSDQTIDTTLNNSLKVKGDANLVAGNIKKDVVIFNTTGTYEGGGGGNLGGLANMVDETSVDISYAFMLSAMKNGNTKGGTITWANAFPNTETLMLSTGLTQLNGIILAQTDRGFGSAASNNQTGEFILIFCRYYTNGIPANYAILTFSMAHTASTAGSHVWGTAYTSAPENGTLRLDGGDIYFTGRYNANNSYQIVRAGEPYEWLAW